MTYVETQTGGWLHEKEDLRTLELFQTPRSKVLYSTTGEIPDRVDPRPWLRIENQANQGACQGHSLTSGVEVTIVREGHDMVQLSRACGYYESQRLDGIRGDSGSTITGGCKLAKDYGICLEKDWPYPSRYNPSRPSNYGSLPKYKIEGWQLLKTYQDTLLAIANGGCVHIGIGWGSSIDQQASSGIVETFRPGGGGHAILLCGYDDKGFNGQKLPGSDPYIFLFNSWSERWGKNGVVLVSPRAIGQMLQHNWTVFAALHGAVLPAEPQMPEF